VKLYLPTKNTKDNKIVVTCSIFNNGSDI